MNNYTPSSRLLKHQRQRLWRQTVIYGVVGVLAICFLLFMVVPNIARFFGPEANTVQDNTDKLPPQSPIMAAPPDATNSATLEITGFAEPKSELVMVLNGQESEAMVVADDGTFATRVSLTEGENLLSAFATDQAGNRSREGRSYQIELDTQAPRLEITSVTDGQTVIGRTQQMLQLAGVTETGLRVWINDRMTIADEQGAFKYNFRLAEGSNEIRLVAEDKAGNQTQQKLTLQFSP